METTNKEPHPFDWPCLVTRPFHYVTLQCLHFDLLRASAMPDGKVCHETSSEAGCKWTNYIKGYQKRWFVLSNGLLSYYRYNCSPARGKHVIDGSDVYPQARN